MFSFNLAKTPLFSRVSRPPSFHSRSPSSLIHHWRTSGWRINGLSRKSRDFSTDSPQKVSRNPGKALPWIAAHRERESRGAEKNSSWEASAERYFSRNDGKKLEEKPRKVEVEVMESEEEKEEKSVDDSRWNRIRTRYERFERPEARRWNKQESWGRKTGKEAAESSVPKLVGQGVYGVGPVLAALTVKRRELYALYVQQGLDLSGNNRRKKDKKGVESVLKMAKEIGLKAIEASKHDLNMVVDNRPHQGLVLDASPLDMVSIRGLEPAVVQDGRAPLWVALDEVTDPQNLGAIVRSAYFFGAEGVIVCAKNSAPLSGVVSKASAGSLELIELRSCKNMMQFLTASEENGWRVLGGSVSSRAVPLSEVEAGLPTVLVLGSEGTGLRPLVERSCTQLIRIRGNMAEDGYAGESETEDAETGRVQTGQELKSFLAVESLNVSVATGVLLYHLIGRSDKSSGEKLTHSM